MYTHWVVGFLFKDEGKEVALVLKTRPRWQEGKLNGPGGKIEHGEAPLNAMRREFREETGADVLSWREFLLLKVQDGQVHFFVEQGEHELRSMTEEKVDWYKVAELKEKPLIPNLLWIIPLALDRGNRYSVSEYEENFDQ